MGLICLPEIDIKGTRPKGKPAYPPRWFCEDFSNNRDYNTTEEGRIWELCELREQ